MRRLLGWSLVVALLLPFAVEVDAQFLLFRKKRPIVDTAPTVIITVPTSATTFLTSAPTLDIGGTCTDNIGCASVAWANSAGGSGTAVGTADWSVTASASALTVAQDTFDPTGSNVDVTLRTSTPSGGTWTEDIDSAGTRFVQIKNAYGAIAPDTSAASGRVGARLSTSPAISGTNFRVSGTASALTADNDDVAGIRFGGVDASNFCAVLWYSTAASVGVHLVTNVAGTVTSIASSAPIVGTGSVIAAEVNGTAVAVKDDGATIISTTSSVCDNGVQAGVVFGNLLAAGNDMSTGMRIDDVKIEDLGAVTSGIALAVGVNTITVTATDTGGNPATDVLIVTRGTDTQAPTLNITIPTSEATHSQSTASLILGGVADDNVALLSVAVSCTNTSPGSPTVTGLAMWSAAAVTLTDGVPAVCTVTATDTNSNTIQKQITVTYTAGDVTAPACTITAPTSAATYEATSATLNMGGTSTDAGTGVDVVTWVNSLGGASGTASGTEIWAISGITLGEGSNAITVTCRDVAGNSATDLLTVAWTPTLTITSSATLPGAVNGAPYSQQLTASGGTAPYTWGNNGGGTSLNDGDAHCAGLTISTGGLVSGTPSATGTCDWTSSIADSAGPPGTDTQTHAIVVAASSGAAHAYAEALLLRSDFHRGWSLRPLVGVTANDPTTTGAFRYQGMLSGKQNDGASVIGGLGNDGVIYDYAGDTDPHKQDAAKVMIYPFLKTVAEIGSTGADVRIVGAMTASSTHWDCTQAVVAGYTCITLVNGGTPLQAPRQLKIDDEVVQSVDPDGSGGPLRAFNITTQEMILSRPIFGTTLAAHAANSYIRMSTNNLKPQIVVPFVTNPSTAPRGTADGYTYWLTWDFFYTDSYVGPNLGQQKSFQLLCHIYPAAAGICFEPNVKVATPAGTNSAPICGATTPFTPNVDVGIFRTRAYFTGLVGGPADWSTTTGRVLGPGTTSDDPICPQVGTFTIAQNRWTRACLRWEQRANDYDYIDMWLSDEQTSATQVYSALPFSVSRTGDTDTDTGFSEFRVEQNSSVDPLSPTRSDQRNYVSYMRNVVLLRSAGLKEAGTLSDAMMPTCARPNQ